MGTDGKQETSLSLLVHWLGILSVPCFIVSFLPVWGQGLGTIKPLYSREKAQECQLKKKKLCPISVCVG